MLPSMGAQTTNGDVVHGNHWCSSLLCRVIFCWVSELFQCVRARWRVSWTLEEEAADIAMARRSCRGGPCTAPLASARAPASSGNKEDIVQVKIA